MATTISQPRPNHRCDGMAKPGAVVNQWMAATEVTISAVRCWTSIEENLGVVPLHSYEYDEQ
jgi:hypothetical protein